MTEKISLRPKFLIYELPLRDEDGGLLFMCMCREPIKFVAMMSGAIVRYRDIPSLIEQLQEIIK